MEGRKQNISQDSSPRNERTVSGGYAGVQTYIGITDNTLTEVNFTEEHLLEHILSPSNLNEAYRQVVSNKGAGGIDGMDTSDLLSWLSIHKDTLINSLYKGAYRPNPADITRKYFANINKSIIFAEKYMLCNVIFID